MEEHRPKVMRRGAEVTEEGASRRAGGAGGLRKGGSQRSDVSEP